MGSRGCATRLLYLIAKSANNMTKSLTGPFTRAPALKFLLLWLAIAVAFACYGFFRDAHLIYGTPFDAQGAIGGGVFLGAFGVGVATCVIAGVLILARVRAGRLRKIWAVLLLAALSPSAACLALLPLELARALFPWFLHGESELAIGSLLEWLLAAALATFVVFTLLLLIAKQRSSNGWPKEPVPNKIL